MKPSHHFIVLIQTIAIFALAIALPATRNAQAAPPRQAGEEPIKATLEDANQYLGGGFVLDPNDSAMKRTREGAYANGDPAAITDYLSITPMTPNTHCKSLPQESWQTSTFHGLPGCSLPYGDHPANVVWEAPAGSQSQGDNIVLDVGSIVDDCYCYVQHPDEGPRVSYDSINALPLAEALNRAAIKNGLYEPMPGEVTPNQPGGVVPGEPAAPTDTGGLFGIPWPILLGSLGIPVAGGLAGGLLSALSAGVSSTAEAAGEATAIDAAEAEALIANQKAVFLGKFEEIVKQKKSEGYFTMNPGFAENPDWPEWSAKGNNVMNWLDGTQGGRCGETTEWGKEWLGPIAKDTFGQDTFVGDILVQRDSTGGSDINHRGVSLILPNGERLVPEMHEALSPNGKAGIYTEKDWLDKYCKIVGGKMEIGRNSYEDQLLEELKKHGIDKAIENCKHGLAYNKENAPVWDLFFKSYRAYPASDPVPPPPPDTPPNPLKDLDGIRKSGLGGHRF